MFSFPFFPLGIKKHRGIKHICSFFCLFFRAQGFTSVAEAVGADHRATEKTAKPQT